jgi:hypothetical protein
VRDESGGQAASRNLNFETVRANGHALMDWLLTSEHVFLAFAQMLLIAACAVEHVWRKEAR